MTQQNAVVLDLIRLEQINVASSTTEYFWSDQSTWSLGAMTRTARAYLQVDELSGSGATIALVAAWSIDGRNWKVMDATGEPLIDNQTSAGTYASDGTDGNIMQDLWRFGPAVRYGIKLVGGATAASAVCTAVVILTMD